MDDVAQKLGKAKAKRVTHYWSEKSDERDQEQTYGHDEFDVQGWGRK